MANLFLLTQVLFILNFNRCGSPFFCQAVVSFVDLNGTAFNVCNAGDLAIKKFPVMGDHQHYALITGQPSFQPDHGVEVQVIGRLIKQ